MDLPKAYLLHHLGLDVSENAPAVANEISEVKAVKTNKADYVSSSILTPATLDYLRSLKAQGIISDDMFTEMVLKAAKGFSEDSLTIFNLLTSDDFVTEKIVHSLKEKVKTDSNKNQSALHFKHSSDKISSDDSFVTASIKEDVYNNTTAKYCILSTSKDFLTKGKNMLPENNNYSESATGTNINLSTSVPKNLFLTAFNYVLKWYRGSKSKMLETKTNPRLNRGHNYTNSDTDDALSFYTETHHTLSRCSSNETFYTAIMKDDGDVTLEKNLPKCYRQTTLSRCSSNKTFYSAIMKEDDDEVTLEKNLPICYRRTTAKECVLKTNSYRNDQSRFCMAPKFGLSKSLPNIYFTLQ